MYGLEKFVVRLCIWGLLILSNIVVCVFVLFMCVRNFEGVLLNLLRV